MAAPSLSAIPSSNLKFSPFCIPRPPEITISAEVNSGRSDLANSSLTKLEISRLESSSKFSFEADPPWSSQSSNPVVLTVTTFIASELLTVAMQLPA